MDWQTLITTIGVGIAVITYLEVRFNRMETQRREDMRDLRGEMNNGFASLRGEVRDLRGEVHDLNIRVHALDVRVARLEGKTQAEAEAELESGDMPITDEQSNT